MRNLDDAVQRHVIAEMATDPELGGQTVQVAVQSGVATLTGTVGRFSARRAAELAAWRVVGVRNVVNMLDVRLAPEARRRDEELADDAAKALSLDARVPLTRLKVTALNGWLTLDGAVDRYYQKCAAEESLRHLAGVIGVVNRIRVAGDRAPAALGRLIEAALHRSALVDASRVHVVAEDGHVTLRGRVASYAERSEATRIAWAFAGVSEVENRLEIAHAQVLRGT